MHTAVLQFKAASPSRGPALTEFPLRHRAPATVKSACSACSLRELCLPAGLSDDELAELDALMYARRRVHRGETLYRVGQHFTSLHAIRVGSFKSTVLHDDGREQVTAFHMAGEILGIDAVGTGRHESGALALEDSEVCVLPFDQLEALSRRIPSLQTHFHRVMSREIVRDHGVMMLLGSMRAEERLVTFLLSLSRRSAARGYSGSEFVLRMNRDDIGSYLGLTLETVSRVFSRFQAAGLVASCRKHIRILDAEGLRRLVGAGAAHQASGGHQPRVQEERAWPLTAV